MIEVQKSSENVISQRDDEMIYRRNFRFNKNLEKVDLEDTQRKVDQIRISAKNRFDGK